MKGWCDSIKGCPWTVRTCDQAAIGLGIIPSEKVSFTMSMTRRELESAMALCGRPSIAFIDSSVIWKSA